MLLQSQNTKTICRFTRISTRFASHSGKAIKIDVQTRAGGHNSLRQLGTCTGISEYLHRKFTGPPCEIWRTSTGTSENLHRKFPQNPKQFPTISGAGSSPLATQPHKHPPEFSAFLAHVRNKRLCPWTDRSTYSELQPKVAVMGHEKGGWESRRRNEDKGR